MTFSLLSESPQALENSRLNGQPFHDGLNGPSSSTRAEPISIPLTLVRIPSTLVFPSIGITHDQYLMHAMADYSCPRWRPFWRLRLIGFKIASVPWVETLLPDMNHPFVGQLLLYSCGSSPSLGGLWSNRRREFVQNMLAFHCQISLRN